MDTSKRLPVACGMTGIVATLLAACTPFAVPRYQPGLTPSSPPQQTHFSVGDVTRTKPKIGGADEIECPSVGFLVPADNSGLTSYVQKAIVAELRASGAFDASSPARIEGSIDRAEIAPLLDSLSLTITLRAPGSPAIHVAKSIAVRGGTLAGIQTCNNAAAAFPGLLQDVLSDAIPQLNQKPHPK